jgi:hypothetical protein
MLMTKMKMFACCAVAALAAMGTQAQATAVTVGVDPSAVNLGYMNVSDINADGTIAGFQFGSGWGFNDLTAVYAPGTLTLGPNTIGDPDPYWYIGGGGPGATGNKFMDANGYAEVLDGSLAGQTLTFQGNVLSNTLVAPPGTDDGAGNFTHHEAFAFIRDFAPGFGSNVETLIPLPASGAFSVSQLLINDPARPVQYGFTVRGRNVWSTDVGSFGNVVIETIPEPGTLVLAGMGLIGVLGARRRRA